jgi:ATP-binding cassette subfamily F protein 3
MISFRNVSKSFGTQTVLDQVNLQINPGERVGVVGPNGAGKSTLFSMMVGEMEPDKGDVVRMSNYRMGYVRQQLNAHAITSSLLEYVEDAIPELREIHEEIHTLEAQLATGGPDVNVASILKRIGDLQFRFEHRGGYVVKSRSEKALCGLGFRVAELGQQFKTFSGGWQSRAELARVLVAEPDILLLDEPSNYLDIPTIEWLQGFLKEFKGSLVLISHDRFLLNSLTTVTIEIANTKAERYPGNYDYYASERMRRFDQRLSAQKNQDRKREKLELFIDRFRSKSPHAAQAQSRIKQLAKMEDISLPQRIVSPGHIRLRPPPHSGLEIIRLEGAGITYDSERWVLRGIDLRITRGEKIAIIGMNGLGKTTLLRLLAGKQALSEGKRIVGHKVQMGYQSQDFAETMEPRMTVYEVVKSTGMDVSDQETRNLLGGFGFSGDAIEKPVKVLSGGEKIRLAFARLLIKPPNFLILDEPTTHLDIQAREALENALQDYQGTLCLVAHDIDFVRHVATEVIAMTPPGITRYSGGYDYYHQKMTEQMEQTGAAGDGRPKAGDRKGSVARPSALPDPQASTVDKKELRRQRAQAREAMYSQTRDLKKDLHRTEKQIEIFEQEKARLVEQMAGDPAKMDFAAMSKRLKFMQEEIERYTRRWEQAAAELQKIEGGSGGDQSRDPE